MSKFRTYGACMVAAAVLVAIAAGGGLAQGSSLRSSSHRAGNSSGKCASGVLKAVNAVLSKYDGAPKFEAPGPAFNASKARGKTVFNIPLTSGDSFAKIVDAWEQRAANSVGVKFIEYQNNGSPSQWQAGVMNAISRHVNLILLQGGPDPRLLRPELRKARAAGIKVVSAHLFDHTDLKAASAQNPDVQGFVGSPHVLGGGILSALYAIAYTKCNVNALMLSATDVAPSNTEMVAAYRGQLKKYCPTTCKVTVISQPYAQWATQATGAIESALNADPSINIVAPQYDYGVTFAQAAITATRRTARTHIVSYNGEAPILDMIAQHKSLLADIGEPLPWLGYANMDQALRLLAGVAPVSDENTPVRLWTSANIKQAGVPVSQTGGYGPVSEFVNGYAKLWGLKK